MLLNQQIYILVINPADSSTTIGKMDNDDNSVLVENRRMLLPILSKRRTARASTTTVISRHVKQHIAKQRQLNKKSNRSNGCMRIQRRVQRRIYNKENKKIEKMKKINKLKKIEKSKNKFAYQQLSSGGGRQQEQQPPAGAEVGELPLVLEGDARYKPLIYDDNIEDRDNVGEKDPDYYCVGSILKARLVEREEDDQMIREFLIKWSGWSEEHNTWEPESNLNGCIMILNRFCKNNKIRRTVIEPRVGGYPDDEHDENNWIRLSTVRRWIIKETNPDIPVQIYHDQELNEDSLILLTSDCHCYVMLYVKRLGIIVIADGRNWYREDKGQNFIDKFFSTLISTAKTVITPSYNYQKGVDDCAVSGIMIGIDLLRRYKRYMKEFIPSTMMSSSDDKWSCWWSEDIHINTNTHKRILSSLRIGRTKLINEGTGRQSIVNNLKWYQCSRCGWRSKTTDGRVISIHDRKYCPNK